MEFWSKRYEEKFFIEALKNFASIEQLFYNLSDGFFAYAPKNKNTEGQTLQSRNSLIGQFTEKWCRDFLAPIAEKNGLFAVNGVVCKEIGLNSATNADIAFCTTNSNIQKAKNIKILFEVKMSIVNNYSFNTKTKELKFEGDYKTHKGNPSILRSDSMLKAIGKSINIRVSGIHSTEIPIIILGNSPITDNYKEKVDYLKKAGVIQGFISLYPNPTKSFVKKTKQKGFQTFNNYFLLESFITNLLESDMIFLSSMLPKKILGEIVAISAKENTEIDRAEKFLQLLNHSKYGH